MATWRNIDIWMPILAEKADGAHWIIANYAHDRTPGTALPVIGEAASQAECIAICDAANARNLELIEATDAERSYVAALTSEMDTDAFVAMLPIATQEELKAIASARWAGMPGTQEK